MFDTPRVACVPCILLVREFLACELHFVSVYDDNIVSTVHVWAEGRLVLATKNTYNLCCQPTRYLILCIYEVP